MRFGRRIGIPHEQPKAYELALRVNHHIAAWQFARRLPRPDFRRIDEAATSVVLNIVEGNGGFEHLDHSRFLDIANQAAAKVAVRLELSAIRGNGHPDKSGERVKAACTDRQDERQTRQCLEKRRR